MNGLQFIGSSAEVPRRHTDKSPGCLISLQNEHLVHKLPLLYCLIFYIKTKINLRVTMSSVLKIKNVF
jgi:hypothetical protein